MADDDLYGILRELTAIRELLERDISSGRENYAAPYNDSFVRDIMSNSRNIQKKDSRTGQYVDTGELDAKSVKTAINDFLKMRDLSTSKSTIFVKKYVDEMKKTHDSYKANSLAQQVYFARAIDKLGKMLFEYSSGAYAKSPVLNVKKGMNNPLGAAFLKKIQAEFQVLHKTNSVVSKIAYLFETDLSGKKSRVRKFTEDLIEGLARSKFVGGALTDFIRLGSFFLASWVKNIPLIGKPLAAIVVALGSLGPSIIGLLSSLLMVRFIPGLGRFLVPLLTKAFGGKIFEGTLGKIMATIFGKEALKGVATRAVGTGATTIIGGKVLGTSAASKGIGLIGNLTKGGSLPWFTKLMTVLGRFAPLLGRIVGFLGPIGVAVSIISLAIPLITGIVKNWDKIMEKVKYGWETITSNSFWKNLWDNITGWFKGIGGNSDPNKVWKNEDFIRKHPFLAAANPFISAEEVAAVSKKIGNERRGMPSPVRAFPLNRSTPIYTSRVGQLKLDQGGVPMNLGELSVGTASKEMEAYRRGNKQLFDSYYEIVPEGLASVKGSFTNDLTMINEDTGKKGAVLYKGAQDDLKSLRQYLVDSGMSKAKADRLVYTSGISTLRSPHSKTGDHSNPLGYGFDLGTGGSWSQKDWEFAIPLVKAFYGQGGFKANYEAIVGGKGRFTSPSASLNNAHFHVGVDAKGSPLIMRNPFWGRYVQGRNVVERAMLEEEAKVNKVDNVVSDQATIGVSPPATPSQVETKIDEKDEFNQNGYTRIIQPDDSHIKSTIPVKKSTVPQIDYTGDEMFSDVLRRTIDAAMRDAVQQ